MEDVKAAAEVSGSQIYDHFPGKNGLVQAVIDYQADTIVKHNRQALGSPKGVEAWRKMVVTGVTSTQGKGGCPLRSLGGQLAENAPGGPGPALAFVANGPVKLPSLRARPRVTAAFRGGWQCGS